MMASNGRTVLIVGASFAGLSSAYWMSELGYEVTVVKDATASYSDEHMHAALDINIPHYASAILTAGELVDSISSIREA